MWGMFQNGHGQASSTLTPDSVRDIKTAKPMPVGKTTRAQPVNRADFPAIRQSDWRVMLGLYRTYRHPRYGIEAKAARREMRVLLETWAWARLNVERAQRKSRRSQTQANT